VAALTPRCLDRREGCLSCGVLPPSLLQAFVVVGDHNGHIGLGVKCAKEVATAIRGAIIQAKMSTVPVRRGYWGNKIGKVHTVPTKVGLSQWVQRAEHASRGRLPG
jgi:hypothetical protein